MFFNLLNEKILRDTSDGHVYQYVQSQEKEQIARRLNGQLKAELNEHSIRLIHTTPDVNVIEEALNRAPMYLNAIKNRGYQSILFVGHFNADVPSWVLPIGHDRIPDAVTPERAQLANAADTNVVFQFLPIVAKMYGYKGEFCYTSPDPVRHRGVMHTLYNNNGLREGLIKCTNQYRHGMPAAELELNMAPGPRFDAVVFLGVPKNQGEDFSADEVRQVFAPYCVEGFDMVDLYYGAPDLGRFIGGELKDTNADVGVAWTTRAQWEENFQADGGRPEEHDIFKRTFKVY